MSDLFNDPVYRNMAETEEGWLELAIEPFRFELNERVQQLPKVKEYGFDYFADCINRGFGSYGCHVTKETLINLLHKEVFDKDMTSKEIYSVGQLYDLQVPDGLVVDFATKTMSGVITLTKNKDQFDDDEVVKMATEIALGQLKIHGNSEVIPRINDIMDLIGATDKRKSRSIRKKTQDVHKTMRDIFLEDKWRIRNSKIMSDAITWISDYCTNGSQYAIMNITRLKCMTHKGNPIYSMEDIK